MREAAAADFIKGATIHNQYGSWKLINKYDDGIWEVKGLRGERLAYVGEARFYKVKLQS